MMMMVMMMVRIIHMMIMRVRSLLILKIEKEVHDGIKVMKAKMQNANFDISIILTSPRKLYRAFASVGSNS